MFHTLHIGAMIGAVLPLTGIPVQFIKGLAILAPFIVVLGVFVAALCHFVLLFAVPNRRRPLRMQPTAAEYSFSAAVASLVIIVGVIPPLEKARDVARRSVCKNKLLNGTHACHGDVVRLDRQGNVKSISCCSFCAAIRRDSESRFDEVIRLVDSNGRTLQENEVPRETLEIARACVRAHRRVAGVEPKVSPQRTRQNVFLPMRFPAFDWGLRCATTPSHPPRPLC